MFKKKFARNNIYLFWKVLLNILAQYILSIYKLRIFFPEMKYLVNFVQLWNSKEYVFDTFRINLMWRTIFWYFGGITSERER